VPHVAKRGMAKSGTELLRMQTDGVVNSLKVCEHYGILAETSVPSEDAGSVLRILTEAVVGVRERANTDKSTKIHSQPPAPRLAGPEQPRVVPMRAKNGVEALDQVLSRPIANLVHDLRTPLVSIRGYTKMILEERAGPINDVQREYLTIAAENTNRVIQLLNDLSKLTSQSLHFEAFDASDLWRESLVLAAPRALNRSIKIAERIPPAPAMIYGDRQKLTEGLADLLFHAIKITEQGREIVGELSSSQDGEVAIAISNIGVGTPAELLNKVFSGAAQGESSSSNAGESLGAGLAVLQDIIRLHGGRISVSSKAGEGVTVSVTLPGR
jgi:signal transduction histidine kinase